MCLGVPGRIVEIYQQHGLRNAKVDFGGAVREACLNFVPEAEVGDYALVHVGFAISLVSEAEAEETLDFLRQIEALGAELDPQP